MLSTKYKLLQNAGLLLIFGALSIGFALSGPVSGKAVAASAVPGCYQEQQSKDSDGKTVTSYQIQNNSVCNSNGNDPTTFCYVSKPPTTAFSKVDCSSIAASSVAGYRTDDSSPGHQCGSQDNAVRTTIDFGCYGEACVKASSSAYCASPHSAVIDLIFAIIRFLSYGVGLIIVASLIVAGIQYSTSQGDPKATAAAETRIRSTIGALLIFIFAYAILNYVIPAGFFGQ